MTSALLEYEETINGDVEQQAHHELADAICYVDVNWLRQTLELLT
jgi:hypothetical protein